jgi:hypothetical protein
MAPIWKLFFVVRRNVVWQGIFAVIEGCKIIRHPLLTPHLLLGIDIYSDIPYSPAHFDTKISKIENILKNWFLGYPRRI